MTAAEELSGEQVSHIIATNLRRAGRPPGHPMYHATKRGIEGFTESVAQEAAPFGIGVTVVEPGGARTEFRYGSAQVAEPMPA